MDAEGEHARRRHVRTYMLHRWHHLPGRGIGFPGWHSGFDGKILPSGGHSYANSNSDGNAYTNSDCDAYCNCHSNNDCDTGCYGEAYFDTEATPDSSASPDSVALIGIVTSDSGMMTRELASR